MVGSQRIRSVVASIPLWLSACSSPDVAFVPFPSDPQFSSIVTLVAQPQARAIADRVGEALPLEVGIDAEVFVLLYGSSLEDLRTPEGELDPESTDRSCRLLDPDAIYRIVRDRDGVPQLAPIEDRLDELLEDASLEALVGVDGRRRCALCPDFDVVPVSTESLGRFEASALMSDGRFVAAYVDEYFLIDRARAQAIDCGPRAGAGTSLPDGRFVVAYGDQVSVLEIDLATSTCTVAESWPPPLGAVDGSHGVRSMAASAPGLPFELWALTGPGELWRRDEAAWTREAMLSLHPEDQALGYLRRSRIVPLGPRSVAVTTGGRDIFIVESGNVRRESPPFRATPVLPDHDRVPAIGRLADGRLVAGGIKGGVFIRDDAGNWSLLPGTPLADAQFYVGGFANTENGFVYAVESGGVGYVHSERGACPEPIRVRGATGRGAQIFSLPDGAVFIADFIGEGGSSRAAGVWLLPK